ncbi:stage II sporulation protein D [Caldicellulosiruptoraceae bacterium PP1]
MRKKRRLKKDFLIITFSIIFLFILIIFKNNISNNKNQQGSTTKPINDKKIYVKVLINNKEVKKMDIEDYIIGVVAAEMPAEFPIEALKAQAVAARTYAVRKIIKKQEHAIKGVYLCDSFEHCQAYITIDEMKKRWGNGFEKYYEKIKKAVLDTKGLVMVYNGEVINSLFHAASGGETEDAKEVFGEDIPYLKSTQSLGEESCPKYSSNIKISKTQFINKLKSNFPNINIRYNTLQDQVKVIERTSTGRVKNIKIGNEIISGNQFREIFTLNSTEFWISFEKNNVIISTKGFGHGVGMSQWGARYYATQGLNYKDILKHYYSNISFGKIK